MLLFFFKAEDGIGDDLVTGVQTCAFPIYPSTARERKLFVVMFGKHEEKLAFARRAGIATKKVQGNPGDLQRNKDSFALLVEATGSPTGLALAQHMTQPRGTLVLKSTFHCAPPVQTLPIVVKEMTLIG